MPQPDRTAAGKAATDETIRTLRLGERLLSYALRRARRQRIGLTIDHRGLRVGAPHRVSLGEIESLIRHHGDWVIKKITEWQARPTPRSCPLVDGLQLPLLGTRLTLRLATGKNRALWNEGGPLPTLTLCLRTPADAPRVLENALREKARALFGERLAHYARQLGVSPPPLALSSARTRWGSCNLRTGIRLNWRLIHFPPHLIDYVVAHELSHLREMNHSPRFWAIVGTLYPDYTEARHQLKAQARESPPLEFTAPVQ